MASAYFSSQMTIESKVKASRVKLWGDKNADGTIDPTTLDQGLSFARSQILAYLTRRYGAQALAWTFDTVPPILRAVSDDLTLYYLATGANAVNPVIDLIGKNALATLSMLRDYEIDLPGVDDTPAIATTTGTTDSVFDGLLISDPSTLTPIIIR